MTSPISAERADSQRLKHLSNWFAGSASWRTAFLLEKCVLHGHTVEQTALKVLLSPRTDQCQIFSEPERFPKFC